MARGVITFIVFLMVVILCVPLKPIHGLQRNVLHRQELAIVYEEPLRDVAINTANLFPSIKRNLEQSLGWQLAVRPTVLLISDTEAFSKIAGTDFIVAFAIPRKNLIVIDNSRMGTHPFSIEMTLKHELCHLLLHQHIDEDNLPRWLDEGIAQVVSGGISELYIFPKRSVLHHAVLSDGLISVRALTKRFPHNKKSLLLAYEESKSLTEYMIGRYGMAKVLRVLKTMKSGIGWEEAILKDLSISFDALEQDWHHDLKKRMTWLTYLSYHLYEILFFLAAMLMIGGAIRIIMKKRAYMRQYEDEDFNHS